MTVSSQDPLVLFQMMEILWTLNLKNLIEIVFSVFLKMLSVYSFEKVLKYETETEHEFSFEMPKVRGSLVNFYWNHKNEIRLDLKQKVYMKSGPSQVVEDHSALRKHRELLKALRTTLYVDIRLPLKEEPPNCIKISFDSTNPTLFYFAHKPVIRSFEFFNVFLNNKFRREEEVLDLSMFTGETVQIILQYLYLDKFDSKILDLIDNTGQGTDFSEKKTDPPAAVIEKMSKQFLLVYSISLVADFLLLIELHSACFHYAVQALETDLFLSCDLLYCMQHEMTSKVMKQQLNSKFLKILPNQKPSEQLSIFSYFIHAQIQDPALWKALKAIDPIQFSFCEMIQSSYQNSFVQFLKSHKNIESDNIEEAVIKNSSLIPVDFEKEEVDAKIEIKEEVPLMAFAPSPSEQQKEEIKGNKDPIDSQETGKDTEEFTNTFGFGSVYLEPSFSLKISLNNDQEEVFSPFGSGTDEKTDENKSNQDKKSFYFGFGE